MKDMIRRKAIRISNSAVIAAALALTACFTACNKDKNVEDSSSNSSKDSVDYELVNSDNFQSFKDVQLGVKTTGDEDAVEGTGMEKTYSYHYNPSKLRYKISEDDVKKVKDELGGAKIAQLGANDIYRSDAGELYTIDNGEALKLIKDDGNSYHVEKSECFDGAYVLTNECGSNTIVFKDSTALDKFADELTKQFEEAEGETIGITNGFSFTSGITTETVELFDREEEFYDIESVVDSCNKAVEALGNLTPPISYSIDEKKTEVIVTRTAYNVVDGVLDTSESNIVLPLGNVGDTYFDPNYNLILSQSYMKDDKAMIGADTYEQLLDIDIWRGQYIIPSTNRRFEDIIQISSNLGSGVDLTVDKNVVITDDQQKVEEYEEQHDDSYGEWVWMDSEDGGDIYISEDQEQEVIDNSEDGQLSEQFMTPIHVEGDAYQKAQMLYEQLCEAYPNIPWCGGGGGRSVCMNTKMPENWELTEDEARAQMEERLAGRTIEELGLDGYYELSDLDPWLSELSDPYSWRIGYTFSTGNGKTNIYW